MTCSTESLIDVLITYKDILILSTAVVDLGLSDHFAQILETNVGKKNRRTKTVVRRRFKHNSVEEFKHLLSKEVWNDVYNA